MRRERERKEKIAQGIIVDSDQEEDTTADERRERIAAKIPRPPALPPFLKVTLVLTPEHELAFSPSRAECISSFSKVITDIESLAGKFASVLHDERLAPFVTRIKFEHIMESEEDPYKDWVGVAIDISGLKEDRGYQNDCTEIKTVVSDNINRFWEKTKSFASYCTMVRDCVDLSMKESITDKEWSTDQFRTVLSKYSEQVEAMNSLPEIVREGFVLLEMLPFRESILPYPQKILSEVHDTLPVIAYRRNEDLLIAIKDATYRLEKDCKDVSQFVEYLQFMAKLVTELPTMEKEFGVIAKMYAIAGEFDVPLPAEELALYRTLLPSFTHLKTTLTYCEATRDELVKKYSRDLEVQIRKLLQDIKRLKNEVRHSNVLADDVDAQYAMDMILDYSKQYKTYSSLAHEYLDYQNRFGSSTRDSGPFSQDNIASILNLEMSETERDIRLRRLLWEDLADWNTNLNIWTSANFIDIDVVEIQKIVKQKSQTVMLLDKALPANSILPQLKMGVNEFKESLPILVALRNPCLKQRHIDTIEELAGITVISDPLCTVSSVLESSYFEHRADIMKISIQASNEATLESMLQKVTDIWKRTEFILVPYKDYQDLFVLSGIDDIQLALEESLVTLATIKGSRFVQPIQNAVDEWDKKLDLFSATIEEWISCQRNWMYLESILTTPDIQRQLPREARLFNQVDKSWKELMRKVYDRPNAIWVTTTPGVLETLQANNANLDKVLRCLEDYLETKRLIFARFYFLSNDDILSLLSNSKNPISVQNKLTKCFGYIKRLVINKEPNGAFFVKGMMSFECEITEFIRAIRVRGNVEGWLSQVETAMFEVVKLTIKNAVQSYYSMAFDDWWKTQCGQVIILVSQIIWNHMIEEAFYSKNPAEQLMDLYKMWVHRLNFLSENVSHDIAVPGRLLALTSLVTIEVHSRDVIRELIENRIATSDDFEWTSQLRYSYDEVRDTVMIRQNSFVSEYGYEYLGSTSRLVVTPLTDRCFMTLTTALNLHLGGSAGGPAGTGKTETVKDLAKGFGKQCVVFNCSEGLEFKMLAQFFSGLTQCGSWFCFDEFNRIDVEVLSVVAQQLQILKRAKDAHLSRCVFEGHEIRVNPSCGFFITMNPSYAGRVELPDNLKSLFRPVAMTIPDFDIIVEVILFSEGFTEAGVLSSKLVLLYQLSGIQLSQQNHYDFGLRAIKAVLHIAGEMRQNKNLFGHLDETSILIHAVLDSSIPKFIAEDVPIFMGILKDLFPHYEHVLDDNPLLRYTVQSIMEEENLLVTDIQLDKTVQLYNTLLARHGVMLVGGTAGGKTTTRDLLVKAIAKLGNSQPTYNEYLTSTIFTESIKCMTLNPKCVTVDKLYGQFDHDSYEWSDGILATIMRKFAKENITVSREPSSHRNYSRFSIRSNTSAKSECQSRPSTGVGSGIAGHSPTKTPPQDVTADVLVSNWRWLVLDGPVDPVWVENLNTVLDDTRILCLANGERIPLTSRMRIILEVDDLQHASPATISRCGMVYMDPVQLGWRPFVENWKTSLPSELPVSGKKAILSLIEMSVDPAFRFLEKQTSQIPVKVPYICIIRSLCCLLSSHLAIIIENGGFGSPSTPEVVNKSVAEEIEGAKRKSILQRHPNQLLPYLSKMYFFCFISSFGSVLEGENEFEDSSTEKLENLTGLSVQARHQVQKIWGGNPDLNARTSFDMFVRDLFDLPAPYGVRLPSTSHNAMAYFFEIDSGQFLTWDTLIPTTATYVDDVKTGCELSGGNVALSNFASEITKPLPTVDTVRIARLTELLMKANCQVLLVGNAGIGKSCTMSAILDRVNHSQIIKNAPVTPDIFDIAGFYSTSQASQSIPSTIMEVLNDKPATSDHSLFGKDKEYTTVRFKLNGQTNATTMESFFSRSFTKMGRDIMGPPFGKSLVMFLDDINMPYPEQFGAQPALEFLRQFLSLQGFYESSKFSWKMVEDVSVTATCTIKGSSSENTIPPRLIRHFSVINMSVPAPSTILHLLSAKLGRFYCVSSFTEDVQNAVNAIASAGLYLYQQVLTIFKPKPAKLHYVFNMHTIDMLFRGMISASPSDIASQDSIVRLYVHETARIFGDRLVTLAERETFATFQVDSMQKYFKELATKMVFTKRHINEARIMFTDFHGTVGDETTRQYRIVNDHSQFSQTLTELQNRFNVNESQDLHIVFFYEAVQHLTRLCRALRQARLHIIQLGVGGTGRGASARLAAFISGCAYKTLNIKRNYSLSDLRDDLKAIITRCGLNKRRTVLFIKELQIIQEEFLEDLDALVSSEAVQHWFDSEEKDYIQNTLKMEQVDDSEGFSIDQIWNIFFDNIKESLHIVLSISPRSSNFARFVRLHPCFLKNCYLDFYSEWPQAALLDVATTFFRNNHLDKILFRTKAVTTTTAIQEQLAPICTKMHCSVQMVIETYRSKENRIYYITPTSYLEFLNHFLVMLNRRNHELNVSRGRLMNGIKALNLSSSMIERMSEELVTLEPQLLHKAKLTELLLKQLEEERAAVDKTKQVVSREKAAVNRENVRIGKIAAEAEADLAAAIPSLEHAIKALDSLDKQDISEVRVYNSPPEMVRKVMEAVCVLLKEKPTWSIAKQLLGDPGLLRRLTNFDKDNIPLKSLTRLQTYTESTDFNPDNVGKISVACKSLCMWVLATENYAKVYRYVLPKKQRFQESMEHLSNAKRALEKKEEELLGVLHELENLQARYNNTRLDRDRLQNRIIQTKKRRDRAQILIKALSGEKVRWADLVEELNETVPLLIGDTLISSAAVVYFGVFTRPYRERLLQKWRSSCNDMEIPLSNKSVEEILSSQIEVQSWYTQGLQRDPFSTENAVLLRNTHRWPLIIDPQGQGKKWLQGLEKNNLKIVPYNSSRIVLEIEQAVRMGTSILFEGLPSYIDSTLYPILDRRACELNGSVVLSDMEIEYNKNFRLYLSTNLSNPHYSPDDCIKVTIINFVVTFSGLQEQLLSRVVKMERPWLEQQKDEILRKSYDDSVQLRHLEDTILETLSSVQTDILDDEDLVNTLNVCKQTAEEIEVRVEEAKTMQNRIEYTRKKYLPVATRGAIMYFVQSQLSNLNCMYNFSLEMFMKIFKTTIHSLGNSYLGPDEDDKILAFNFNTATRDKQLDFKIEKHITDLVENTTANIHKHVVCSLYSRHHLVYTMMLCVKILQHTNAISDTEWDAFLHGGTLKHMPKLSLFGSVLEDDAPEKSSSKSKAAQKKTATKPKRVQYSGKPIWLSTAQWEGCNMLDSTMPAFQGLTKHMQDKPEFWQALMISDNPYQLFDSTRSRSSSNVSHKSSRSETSLDNISEDTGDIGHSQSLSILPSETSPRLFWKWQNLSSFQRIMIIRVLRADQIGSAAQGFITHVLGERYTSVPEQNLMNIFKNNKCQNPILFILSPGVDPTSKLQRLLKDLNEEDDMLEMLSVGRGQGPRIEEILRSSMSRGRWVFLQNCHFGQSWLQNLQKIVYSMQLEKPNPKFRLWLSSLPDPAIPTDVVRHSVKVAMEQPQGIKANLHQAFVSGVIEQDVYNDPFAGQSFRKLVYNLCLFNSVILERRKYGSLGWNIPYEFTNSDLEVCIQVLHQLLTEYSAIPWKALQQLAGTVLYGGRVTDKWDQRTLSSILNKFFNPEAIKPGYRFTSTEPYTYWGDLSIDETISFISSLPSYDSPELFGMHQNADRTFHEHTGRQLINYLSSLSSTSKTESHDVNNDTIVLKFLIHIHTNVPEKLALPSSMESTTEFHNEPLTDADRPPSVLYEKGYVLVNSTENIMRSRSPMQNVIRQEVKYFNQLLSTIHKTVMVLGYCLQGVETMTNTLQTTYKAILENKLPKHWKKLSYQSGKSLSHWLEDLTRRIVFMKYWIDLSVEVSPVYSTFRLQYSDLLAERRDLNTIPYEEILNNGAAFQPSVSRHLERLPRSFWIGALFYPQGLLTAALQSHARKYSIPIDNLAFVHYVCPLTTGAEEVDKTSAKKAGLTRAMWGYPAIDVPEDGILIHGLYLDGGRWDGKNIVESLPGKQITPLPEIHFMPSQVKPVHKDTDFECPVYRTKLRCGPLDKITSSQNYITSLHLPSEQLPNHWVTRGLAILAQTDD